VSIFILVFSMFIFLYIGLPVAFCTLLSSILYLLINGSLPYVYIAQRMVTSLNSFTLLAIPLFIIAGNLMNELKVSEKIFDFASSLVGHYNGGLGHVNVIASLIFSGMSGSQAADAAGLGCVEIKTMNEAGYPRPFTAAITAASSAIGPIVPPSVMLLMYGVMTRTSVGELFVSGFIPGILMAIALMFIIYRIAKRRKFPKGGKFSFSRMISSFKGGFFALLSPVILLILLITGIVTPTELGVILVFYTLLVGLIYKSISLKCIAKALVDSNYMICQILLLIASAEVFSTLLLRESLPEILLNIFEKYPLNNTTFFLLLSSTLLILGCFMEGLCIEVLMIPLVTPIALKLGDYSSNWRWSFYYCSYR